MNLTENNENNVPEKESKEIEMPGWKVVLYILLSFFLIGSTICILLSQCLLVSKRDKKIEAQAKRIEELEDKLNSKTTLELGPLPCPFCGSNHVEVLVEYGDYIVRCHDCLGQTGRSTYLDTGDITLDEAIAKWNNLDGLKEREELKDNLHEE